MSGTPTESKGASVISASTIVAAVTGGISLVIGELFFKFGSFSLEVVAFLASWGLLYQVGRLVVPTARK